MKSIVVKICMGTTCFVMGGSQLQDIESVISREFGKSVEVIAQTCLGACKDSSFTSAPYVLVDDIIVSEATIERVVEAIRSVQHE